MKFSRASLAFNNIKGKGKLGLWPLVMTIFFCVSGGPYGLETIVQSGRGVALLLIVLVPLVWALPIALMSAELGSAIPEEGGYYEWVKRGVGSRAGFACAWLTYLYSCVDVAIYPVLFTKYLGALGFDLSDPIANLAVRLAMVIPLTWLNIRGAVTTGNAALVFAVVLLVPFIGMVALGFIPSALHLSSIVSPLAPQGVSTTSAIATGLFVIMWNYLGWDSISTISREIKDPRRVFPKALMIGLPLVVLFYFLPVFVGLNAVPDITKWTEGSWPLIARAAGGECLEFAVGIGGLLSAAGLFVAGLLAASRIPFVLAADGYMPSALTKLNTRYATPARAITLSAAIYVALSGFSFEQLAEVDVLLYSSALLLEFWALIQLRRKQPNIARPFRIMGGMPTIILISLLPALLIVAATIEMLSSSLKETVALFAFAALSGIILIRFKRPGVQPDYNV
ncbi:MAG: APC family permease [Bacteroidota bacterium]|nr:APC family permease [Bacteroidota bacterium]MDP4231840.1 APC family permease [Bacteroidota bacterium]MDP4242726.1 APC family permease [Bacteroidota bacterium]MDP4287177.1 APC family permease [Bacteroidota bacterium]